jgi:hypothetical protein
MYDAALGDAVRIHLGVESTVQRPPGAAGP